MSHNHHGLLGSPRYGVTFHSRHWVVSKRFPCFGKQRFPLCWSQLVELLQHGVEVTVVHGGYSISGLFIQSSLLVVNPQVVSFHNVTMNVNAIVKKFPVGLAVVNTTNKNVIAPIHVLQTNGARRYGFDYVSDLDEFHLGILLEEFNRASRDVS